MLAAVDQWMKSVDPNRDSRWLLLPSGIVVALMLPWVLGGFSRRWISRSFALAQLASFGSVRCIQLHRSEHSVAHATLLGRESRLFLVACASCCVVYHAGPVLRLVLAISCVITSVAHQPSNQSMKPTSPFRNASGVFARHPAVAYLFLVR
jgi:hypothetical protein